MIFLSSLMDAALPVLIARGINQVAVDGAANRIGLLVFAILMSGVLAWCFNFVRQWLTARTVGNVVLEVREDAFDAVMARDMSFYDEFSTGKIVSAASPRTPRTSPPSSR